MSIHQTGHSVKAPPRPHVPDAELAVQLLRKYFFSRTDRVAVRRPTGSPSPADPENQLNALIRAHLLGKAVPTVRVRWVTLNGKSDYFTGRPRLGTYLPAADGTTVFGCVDADGKGHHSAPLKDPRGVALDIRGSLDVLKITSFLEKSGSGTGWHVWTFFDKPVPARKVRELLYDVIPSEVELADGTKADGKSKKGPEVFPKQDSIADGGLGNMLWLPWWSEAPEGANVFYTVAADSEVTPFAPRSFEREACQ
jgi:hypothetical protein